MFDRGINKIGGREKDQQEPKNGDHLKKHQKTPLRFRGTKEFLIILQIGVFA